MFKLNPINRLNLWRNFRYELDTMPLLSAIESTQTFWQKCPFVPFYLDITDPKSWPTPWDLIIENYYCDVAKVLGIVYTLHLTSHRQTIEPEIRIYNDSKTRHAYALAYFCNGKYVLNLIEGSIVNKEHINQDLILKHCYNADDLQLKQY